MDEKPMNGASAEELPALPDEEAAPQLPPQVAAAQLKNIVNAQVEPVIGVVFRGVMVSAGGVPPNILLPAIARAAGKMLAMSVAGNTIELMSAARRDFIEAFKDGVQKVPLLTPAGGQMPGMPPHPPGR